jgi:hypothetical protein
MQATTRNFFLAPLHIKMESNIPESSSNTHFFKDPIRKGHAIFYLVPYADNKLEQDFLKNFIFLNPETIPKKSTSTGKREQQITPPHC